MSKIEKLYIQGIRSFDPRQGESLEFYTPLTLIVGHNGAGKTTIIECLKYATTGDQPPNSSKNAAFIYDPKLLHANEVKAQVKLRLRNVNGDEVVCTRSLSVTQNATTRTMKTLESLLLIRDPVSGEQYSVSSKCSEIDEELPHHLGVSKPILDNVIFCHQEDSFWPLSEPSVLKKKFDDIFAATRYTKALTNLKDLRKKLAADLKIIDVDTSHKKVAKEKAAKVRISLAKITCTSLASAERISQLDSGEIQTVVSQMSNLLETQSQMHHLYSKREQLTMEKDMNARNIESLSENLDICNETDEELQRIYESHSNNGNRFDTDHRQLEDRKMEIQALIGRGTNTLNAKLTLRGQFQAEKDQHVRLLTERKNLAIALLQTHKLAGASCETTQEITRFIQRLQEECHSLEMKSKRSRTEIKEREDALVLDAQKVRSSIASCDENKRITAFQVTVCEGKITEFKRDQVGISATRDELEDVISSISSEQAGFERLSGPSNYSISQSEENVNGLVNSLQEKEGRCQTYRDLMSTLNLQADTRARLLLKKTELSRKTELSTRSIAMIRPELNATLSPRQFKIDSVQDELKNILRAKTDVFKVARETHLKRTSQISVTESQIMQVRNELKKKTKELDGIGLVLFIDGQTRIREVIGNLDYETALQQSELTADTDRDASYSMKSASQMYKKFIMKFKEAHECPLCARGFTESNEARAFLTRLEAVLEAAPVRQKEAMDDLARKEGYRRKLRGLSSTWDAVTRLQNVDLPQLRAQRDILEKEKQANQISLDDSDAEVAMLDVEMSHLNTLCLKTDDYLRVLQEMKVLDRDVTQLQQDLSSTGSNQTIDEVSALYEQTQSECTNLRREIDRLNSDARNKQREISTRENRIHEFKTRQSKLEFQLKEYESIASQIIQQTTEKDRLMRQNLDTQRQIAEITKRLNINTDELDSFRKSSQLKQDLIDTQYSGLQTSLSRIFAIEIEVQRFIAERKEHNLDQIQSELKTLQQELNFQETELCSLTNQLDMMFKKRSEILVVQRRMDDNLKVRRMGRESDRICVQIVEIETELSQFDQNSIKTQHNALKTRHQDLVGERAELMGGLKQIQEQMKRLDMELKVDYKDVDRLYKKARIEQSTDKMAVADLEKYAKALDMYGFVDFRAIMKYHSLKMEEINKIIRELWMKTYKGSDIDTVEIRSDTEGQSATQRSYNYRVVMIKGDAEMDMRGRCSAGQKVLSSIIIRLALAETFCLNCGILALDEPTTNLDRENVNSLAESLVEIIEVRRRQSNFQLIIITHDEMFLQRIGRRNLCDYFYRVSKSDTGESVITREAI